MPEHQELKICIGVKPVPGDTASAETGYEELTLIGATSGLMLRPGGDGWSPQIAQSKPGIWEDGPYTPGRIPDALPEQNVIETLRCEIVAGSQQEVNRYIEALNRFIARARRYFEMYAGREPVFLHWWATGASGPQYALIYNIDAALGDWSADTFNDTSVSVTMTIEREPAWRWGVAPGANPKWWSMRDRVPDVGDFDLTSSQWNLVNGTYNPRLEYDPTDYYTLLSKNHVDIPAELIPGDAPALVCMVTAWDDPTGDPEEVTAPANLHVAVRSGPTSLTGRDGQQYGQNYIMNLGDGGAAPTADATLGVYSNGSSATRYYWAASIPASSTLNSAWIARKPSATNGKVAPDINLTAGTYMVFIRAYATNGAAGNVYATLELSEGVYEANSVVTIGPADLELDAAASNSWPLLYLGQVTLPFSGRAMVDMRGRGLVASEDDLWTLNANLILHNRVASTRTARVLDIIFIPIDEGAAFLAPQGHFTATNFAAWMVLDNTGYFGRGDAEPIGRVVLTSSNGGTIELSPTMIKSCEVRGQGLTLQPHVNNRLHFLPAEQPSAGVFRYPQFAVSGTTNPYLVYVNIVPRSYGPRTD